MTDNTQYMLGQIAEGIKSLDRTMEQFKDDIIPRVKSLEKDRDNAKGVLWGIGALGGAIGAGLSKFLGLLN